ncbi:MAG TPA: hypothetical protein VH438_01065 [Gemmatimonadales bacterium]
MTTKRLPWWIITSLVAGVSIEVSLLWDLSWHLTIGRDTFWTPAHIGLQLGGILGGATGGWLVFQSTWGPLRQQSVPVRWWRGPVGAWVMIWGACAMVVSAPLDNWWHGAYGLDVAILSPPHIILVLGMAAVVAGGALLIASYSKRDASALPARLLVVSNGLLVLMGAFLISHNTSTTFMHSSNFYQLCAVCFPAFLIGATASGARWAMTAAALTYTVVRLAMVWILPLFPAQPLFGPVYFRPTHFVPPDFPLLLIFPAMAMDLTLEKARSLSGWRLSFLLGSVFVLVLLIVQWPFANFLMSPAANTWFFASDRFRFNLSPATFTARRLFYPWDASPVWFGVGLGVALLLAAAASRLGLAWRGLLTRVLR